MFVLHEGGLGVECNATPTLPYSNKMWKEAALEVIPVICSHNWRNIENSQKCLVCFSAGDVHLDSIDFIPITTPSGINSADLIDQSPLCHDFQKTAESPAKCSCRSWTEERRLPMSYKWADWDISWAWQTPLWVWVLKKAKFPMIILPFAWLSSFLHAATLVLVQYCVFLVTFHEISVLFPQEKHWFLKYFVS